jgi:hypothetical protein
MICPQLFSAKIPDLFLLLGKSAVYKSEGLPECGCKRILYLFMLVISRVNHSGRLS